MAEFKFPCPLCGQSISCDTRHAGSQIHCPACQQTIVVPRSTFPTPPPDEPIIVIKVATLKRFAFSTLGLLLTLGIACFSHRNH